MREATGTYDSEHFRNIQHNSSCKSTRLYDQRRIPPGRFEALRSSGRIESCPDDSTALIVDPPFPDRHLVDA